MYISSIFIGGKNTINGNDAINKLVWVYNNCFERKNIHIINIW